MHNNTMINIQVYHNELKYDERTIKQHEACIVSSVFINHLCLFSSSVNPCMLYHILLGLAYMHLCLAEHYQYHEWYLFGIVH